MHKTATAISVLKVSAFVACVTTLAWNSSARADGSSLPYGQGGMIAPQVDQILERYNKSGELFRIEGICRSSCTMFLAGKTTCVDPSATLQFHASILRPDQPVDPRRNQVTASHYNSKLRSFVFANHYLDSWTFHSISGQDIIQKFGYRRCPPK